MLLAIPLAVAGLVMAPVTAIVGAGVGAGAARSKEEIAAAETSMTTALDEARVAAGVRERMVVLAEERAGRRVHDCGDSTTPAACVASAEPPVSMLLIMEMSQHLWVQGSIEPTLRLLLTANATVLRVSDGATIYWRSWIYRGGQQGYFDLAADNAKLFRAELKTATDALAAKVVDDILIGGRE